MRSEIRIAPGLLLLAALPGLATAAPEADESIEVVAATPAHGVGLPKDKLPFKVETVNARTLQGAQTTDVGDFLNRTVGSVSVNAGLANPLQTDLQFRGFTASPVLGLPQGLAIFQNGVRINQPFSDTIDWDLIPQSAIASMNLIAGANPIFGLNTLGGAISMEMKNGFTHPGHSVEVTGGSFGRVATTLESGGNDGRFGYYANVSFFDEDGWRDASPSRAVNFYSSLGWHTESATLDIDIAHADTDLLGNGPVPAQLLAQDRAAIFTTPDQSLNEMTSVELEGTRWFGETVQLSGNLYWREIDTDYLNGNDTAYDECSGTGPAVPGFPPSGGLADYRCREAGTAGEEPLVDRAGNFVGADVDAINNRDQRRQRAYGLAGQSTFGGKLFGHDNQFILGVAYGKGDAEFNSQEELARLTAKRSTFGLGSYVLDGDHGMKSRATNTGVYLTDTFDVTQALALTVSGRYNHTDIVLRDTLGNAAALNGESTYERFNPAVGATFKLTPAVSVFGSYSESSRAPTPVELACASPDAPCTLPNAFLADPPLKQVVAESLEGGFRGTLPGHTSWSLSAFRTISADDIVFQSSGGSTGAQGFFANVGDTSRIGMELEFDGDWRGLHWFADYSFVQAEFDDSFTENSANHPLADANGQLLVPRGASIPGIPEHAVKIGGDYGFASGLTLGADLAASAGQYLRGDEANLLGRTAPYAIVNVRGEYHVNEHVTLLARVENLFDTDYETFGALGDATQVLGAGFHDARFLSPGAPIGGWVGVRLGF
ncbi:MAG: TonB-dependent receptor [Gammaproteobacteria bacterium]|nr:TonB-dependent receptor [Gammaproteobacteria bacterium]